MHVESGEREHKSEFIVSIKQTTITVVYAIFIQKTLISLLIMYIMSKYIISNGPKQTCMYVLNF